MLLVESIARDEAEISREFNFLWHLIQPHKAFSLLKFSTRNIFLIKLFHGCLSTHLEHISTRNSSKHFFKKPNFSNSFVKVNLLAFSKLIFNINLNLDTQKGRKVSANVCTIKHVFQKSIFSYVIGDKILMLK